MKRRILRPATGFPSDDAVRTLKRCSGKMGLEVLRQRLTGTERWQQGNMQMITAVDVYIDVTWTPYCVLH